MALVDFAVASTTHLLGHFEDLAKTLPKILIYSLVNPRLVRSYYFCCQFTVFYVRVDISGCNSVIHTQATP